MVRLDTKRIQEELQRPSKASSIQKAIAHQDWIRLHAENTFSSETTTIPYRNLTDLIKSQLPEDKYRNALSLLRFPLPTVEIVDSIFNHLSEIFTGRNPVYNYQFMKASDAEDWEWYRANMLKEPSVWSKTAWEYFRTEINSIVVIDMPKDLIDGRVQPYFYFVPISKVISYGTDRKGDLEWVMFKDSEDKLTVIDGERYRQFEIEDGRTLGAEILNNEHHLGNCPSNFFWADPISVIDRDVKKSPLSKALDSLDWYVFKTINNRNLDIYGSYPIYWAYEEECGYEDGNGNVCDHGIMTDPNGKNVIDPITNTVTYCPKCSQHRLTGAGSFVKVPIPSEDQPDLSNPVGMLGVDSNSLDYNVKELERQKRAIIDACVGKDSDIVQEASLTEKQIDATFEKRTSVLENVKQNFERIQQFVDSTICRLRYGNSFMHCSINYGTSFFTLTVDTLRKRFETAKNIGASQAELQALSEQIIQTEYRHNPQVLERLRILLSVEPYSYLSRNDVLNLYEKGVTDLETFELKADFNGYITRFERENGNITEFGLNLPFQNRIDIIKQSLKAYVGESIKQRGTLISNARQVSTNGGEGGEPNVPCGSGEGAVQS